MFEILFENIKTIIMKTSTFFLTICFVLFTFSMFAQSNTRYTRIGLTFYEPAQIHGTIPDNMDIKHGWVVPPIFLESDRRFAKFFTLGTEISYGKHKWDMSTPQFTNIVITSNLGFEVQGKLSIPLVDMFEIYAQYGIGYGHTFINNTYDIGNSALSSKFSFGSINKTLSVGASIILFDSFGFFAEAGVRKSKSIKTQAELFDASTSQFGANVPTGAQVGIPEQRDESSAPFVKLGVVFQMTR